MMVEIPVRPDSVEQDDDSDWEYEYHETETESFYVTLDISSLASSYRPKNKPDAVAPEPKPGAATATPNARPENINTPDALPIDPSLPSAAPDNSAVALSPSQHSPPPEDRVQILDLHTSQPIISYQSQLYTCTWASTLGTDILLTTPSPDFPHTLYSTPEVSVLATTSIKLSAQPIELRPLPTANPDNRQIVRETSTTPETSTPTPHPNASAEPEDPTPIKIPLGPRPSRPRQQQAAFLERLMAIKRQKGETDSVTVYATTHPTGPPRQRQPGTQPGDPSTVREGSVPATPPTLHRTSLAARARGASKIGRPRSSRVVRGRARQPGGLFRDYRPKGWDGEGADIRGETPDRWVDLESGSVAEEGVEGGENEDEGDDGGGAGVGDAGSADAMDERSSGHLGQRSGAVLDDAAAERGEEGEVEMEDA